MMSMMARRTAAIAVALVLGAPAYAQVLHERVIVGGIKCANGVCWKDGRPTDGAAGIVVDGEGAPAPAPVAADARILASRTEPVVDMTFARDGADNQYVMSTAGGRHRLVWLTDAPQRYFYGDIAPALRIDDEPRLQQAVPPSVRRRA